MITVQTAQRFPYNYVKLKMADELNGSSKVKYLCLFAQEHVDFRISVGRFKLQCQCNQRKVSIVKVFLWK